MLETMVATGFAPLAVLTLPLRQSHRHSDFVDLRPLAGALDAPIIECDRINAPEVLQRLRGLSLDVLFVVGWSQLLRSELLEIPRLGCIGFHPAPLPQLRGRAV